MATEAIEVVGREEELEVILAFVGDVQSFPAALLLEGEAGIGKTTLWQAGIAAAVSSSFRVLVARPVEGETAFSFAALGDLLEGCLDEVVPVLPPPQCKALEVALSLTEPGGPPPDQRAVAMAFLGALRALAVSGPVLVAVDDVQWLDPPSAGIVRFAARRLRGESVGHLLAWRDEDEQQLLSRLDAAFPASPLRRIRVGPLSFGAVHRLLRDRLGTAFPRPTLQRIHEASGGNPFFALELGRALEARGKQLDPGESLPGVEELVRNRLDALPRETLTALSAAAALSQPTVALVSRAGRADSSKLEPAVRANVIELDGDRVRFTHPLLASAAYGTVDAEGRRELHGRLAEIVDDPEEKARHLARSATGADGTVAAALDKAARLAAARGANTAAAELAEQARELTPEHQLGNAVRRTLLAARHHFEAGDAARARALLEDAAASEADSSLRAEALTRLARAHVLADDVRLGADYYRQALVLAGPGDALRAEAEGGLALALFRMLEDLPEAAQHARAAAELSEKRGDRRMQADFLAEQSLVDALLGRRGATAVMRRAAALLEPSGRLAELPQSMFLRGTWGVSYLHALLLLWTDDPSGARSELEHTLERVRELGDEGSLPLILRHMSYIEWLAGHWTEAARLADEGYEVAQQMGQPIQQALLVATRAFVHAHCGLIDSARRDAEEGLALASDTGEMWAMVLSLAALGALELALENPGETHAHLGPIAERVEKAGVREPGAVVARFLPDEIEALIALDRLDHAERLLERLEQRAGVLDRVSALAAAGRCRGLLCAARGDLVGAGDAVDRALHEHGRLSMPFEKARTMLVLGSVQRRARDRRGARASFEQALALFETLGATLWARRTRAELGRIAGRPPATGGLTAAEQRVAELVAAGRTNKEVAAELVVAVRTVESTLTKVYAKLGVRSRTELSHRLRVSEPSKTT